MKPRTAFALAWSLWGLLVVMLISTVVLSVTNGTPIVIADVTGSLAFLALATVGAVVASRQPKNPLGWIYCASAVLMVSQGLLTEYSHYVSYTRPGLLPGGVFTMWVANWVWAPGFALVLVFSFLLFPDGHLPSRRWRPAAWCSVGLLVLLTIVFATYTDGYTDSIGAAVPNPYTIPALARFSNAIFGAGQLLFVLPIVLALASLVVRFRRSHDEEREQIKWLLWSATVITVFNALPLNQGNSDITSAIQSVLITLIPISAGIAIMKYRLYDIDVIINKTFVYGALAAFITVVYVAIVVGLGRVIGSSNNVALSIAATAVVAIAFQPMRERLQRYANRLIYGKRATPYEVMAGFSRRVAGTLAVDQALPEMAEAAARGVGASHGRVRLFLANGAERVVDWPVDTDVKVGSSRAIDVLYQGDPVGEISVTKQPGETNHPGGGRAPQRPGGPGGPRTAQRAPDRRAGGPVGGAVGAIRSAAGLETAARHSPRRTAPGTRARYPGGTAATAPRHRAASRRCGGARRARRGRSGGDPRPPGRAGDGHARGAARPGARIFPPLLVDKGVVAALEAHIRKVGANARVEAASGLAEIRFDADVEACVYFCCAQAVQNVIRHAGNAPSMVALALDGGILTFSVRDEGPGFGDAARPDGMGMRIMQDRIDALEGVLTVESAPGRGTLVVGRVPASAMVAAS